MKHKILFSASFFFGLLLFVL